MNASDTSPSKTRIFFAFAIIILCLLWTGMILGISFLETPVKFTARTITVAVALDVGQTVFRVFTATQLGLLVLVVLAVLWARSPRIVWALIVVVGAALVIQAIWLLPVLDARVAMVQSGIAIKDLPKTTVHDFFAVTEVAKLVGLLWLGIGGINRLRGT